MEYKGETADESLLDYTVSLHSWHVHLRERVAMSQQVTAGGEMRHG